MILGHRKDDYKEAGSNRRREMEKIMSECDLVLSDCYASIVPQFHTLQEYINDKCIYSKLDENSYKRFNNSSNHNNERLPLYHPPFSTSAHHSLIPQLCEQIDRHYYDLIN